MIPPPIIILAMPVIRAVDIAPVEVISVIISSPIRIALRTPVVIATIGIPADRVPGSGTNDQRYACARRVGAVFPARTAAGDHNSHGQDDYRLYNSYSFHIDRFYF